MSVRRTLTVAIAAGVGLLACLPVGPASAADTRAYRTSSDGRFLEIPGEGVVIDTVSQTEYRPSWVGFTVDPAPGCNVDQTLSTQGSLLTLTTCTKKGVTRTRLWSMGLDDSMRNKRLYNSRSVPGIDAAGAQIVWPRTTPGRLRAFDVADWAYRKVSRTALG